MASTNLKLVRSIFAAWERGDFGSVEWAHREIEWVFADGLNQGTWTGPGGIASAWGEFLAAWEDLHAEADEYRELDDDRVFVLYHFTARGKTSGLALGQMRTEGAILFHMLGDKVRKAVFFTDRERGLAELGLGSEGGSPPS
jgi:ketosteroid isomerase-like protein